MELWFFWYFKGDVVGCCLSGNVGRNLVFGFGVVSVGRGFKSFLLVYKLVWVFLICFLKVFFLDIFFRRK